MLEVWQSELEWAELREERERHKREGDEIGGGRGRRVRGKGECWGIVSEEREGRRKGRWVRDRLRGSGKPRIWRRKAEIGRKIGKVKGRGKRRGDGKRE